MVSVLYRTWEGTEAEGLSSAVLLRWNPLMLQREKLKTAGFSLDMAMQRSSRDLGISKKQQQNMENKNNELDL